MKKLSEGSVIEVPSKNLHVGDVLFIEENEEIPCDCVVLYSSNANGICYIQTANIDGETNLKLRCAPSLTQKKLEKCRDYEGVANAIHNMDAMTIECPPPNSRIYDFPAVLRQGEDSTALDASSLFLQVCHLCNTRYMYKEKSPDFWHSFAAVVYTGNETKFGQNKDVPEMKLTKSDRMINWFTVVLFCFQVVCG